MAESTETNRLAAAAAGGTAGSLGRQPRGRLRSFSQCCSPRQDLSPLVSPAVGNPASGILMGLVSRSTRTGSSAREMEWRNRAYVLFSCDYQSSTSYARRAARNRHIGN